ncbi:hypothetical protein OROGR_015811 [Orobanche gracilis]
MAVCDLPRRRFRRCPAVTISADGVRFERTGRSSLTDYGKCPITGEPLAMDDIVPIKSGKNSEAPTSAGCKYSWDAGNVSDCV